MPADPAWPGAPIGAQGEGRRRASRPAMPRPSGCREAPLSCVRPRTRLTARPLRYDARAAPPPGPRHGDAAPAKGARTMPSRSEAHEAVARLPARRGGHPPERARGSSSAPSPRRPRPARPWTPRPASRSVIENPRTGLPFLKGNPPPQPRAHRRRAPLRRGRATTSTQRPATQAVAPLRPEADRPRDVRLRERPGRGTRGRADGRASPSRPHARTRATRQSVGWKRSSENRKRCRAGSRSDRRPGARNPAPSALGFGVAGAGPARSTDPLTAGGLRYPTLPARPTAPALGAAGRVGRRGRGCEP